MLRKDQSQSAVGMAEVCTVCKSWRRRFRLRLCYFSSCGWFDGEAWSHDRRTNRKHVKEPARLQQSDLLSLKAHDHKLKMMMFFLRIERSAKD
jgi:hypothetical protein